MALENFIESHFESAALALPAVYMRYVIGADEPLPLRVAMAVLLGLLSQFLLGDSRASWIAVCAVLLAHAGSAVMFLKAYQLVGSMLLLGAGSAAAIVLPFGSDPMVLAAVGLTAVTAAAVTAFGSAIVHALRADPWKPAISAAVLALAVSQSSQLLPLEEFALARQVTMRFVGQEFDAKASRLALTTIHAQFALGHLGVAYLRSAQLRKNRLMEVGRGSLGAATFVKSVGSFIVLTAAPYMAQRTLFESINEHALRRFVDSVENALRLDAVLADGGALGTAAASNLTVEAHAEGLREVTLTAYRIFERKVFSLPKLALFPAIVYRHPALTTLGLPLALAIDAAKGKVSAYLTERIEHHRRTARRLSSKRSRIEAHDAAHAALIEAANGTSFTREHWAELTLALQSEERTREVLQGLRNWVGWLYWQDVLQPGIECAVAWLLEQGHIGMADLWLYARVLEDGIDAILTRSRKEAQLARLRTDAARLEELANALSAARSERRVNCEFGTDSELGDGVAVAHVRCAYIRGNARLDTGELTLTAGVYALAGPNGCGKSTLLAVVSSCARNGALPPGITLDGRCTASLPSTDLVEVTQRQWCPLHTAPVRWLARGLPGEPSLYAERAAALAVSLRFSGRPSADTEADEVAVLAAQWIDEQEDYCGGLSGGQRAKLELIRAVFLRPACPAVLLLDEIFAPLDPASKAIVMRKIKSFCSDSIVLAVYHPDSAEDGAPTGKDGVPTGSEVEDQAIASPSERASLQRLKGGDASADELCEAGVGGFFDGVLEVQDGTLLPLRSCRQGQSWSPETE